MARIEWVQHRLENWARWHAMAASGGIGFASQAAFLAEPVDCDASRESRIPIDEVDASVTNDAVESLKLGNGHLYQTLRLFYLKGLGIAETARIMRRALSTIHAHLGQADRLVANWLNERARARVSHARPSAPVVRLLTDAEREELLGNLARERRLLELRRAPFVGPPRPNVRRARPVLRLRGSFTT